ncbi:MAG: hypothetical protein R3229_00530 [Alphaproteobacteria bacterium]|nr:hypothetical protein [Alphaproteobacteria bacterium]
MLDPLARQPDEASAIDQPDDDSAEAKEAQMMAALDADPRDESLHAAIIQQPYLSEAMVMKLAALVSPKLFERLISRHPVPATCRREVLKRRRGRPEWWTRGLLGMGR